MRCTLVRFTSVVGFALLLVACGDDDTSTPGDKSPVGGWKSTGRYACFSADGRASFGDQSNEVSTPSGTWTKDGKIVLTDSPNEHATWTINADGNLLLSAPTSCTNDCGPFLYTPDNSLPCFSD